MTLIVPDVALPRAKTKKLSKDLINLVNYDEIDLVVVENKKIMMVI